MKKVIVSSLFCMSIAVFASAQTGNKNSESKVSTSSHNAKKVQDKKASDTKTASGTVELNNRKEYMKDGQLATPTGHEATPINSDEFQSKKNLPNNDVKKQ